MSAVTRLSGYGDGGPRDGRRSLASLRAKHAPVVRTTLSPLLALACTTTLNFSSSHIQLVLSRNVRVPPSVRLPFHSLTLYSASLSVAQSLQAGERSGWVD